MPVVVQPGGNMFVPQPDPGAVDQQPAAGQLGAIMPGAAQSPMQPAQSPEEHAQNKAGWLDWLRNPSTSAFLMQFGASMLQPNVRGFGAQLGQSVGEAGQAVARVSEQQRAQMEAESKAATERAQAGYYEAETKAQPSLAEARLTRAQAAETAAAAREQAAQSAGWYRQQIELAVQSGDYARAQLLQAQADALRVKTTDPGRAMYEKEHEAWVAGGELGPEPKPTDPAYQFGTTAAPGTATPATPATTKPTAPPPMPSTSPEFMQHVWTMSQSEIEQTTRTYAAMGGQYWKTWQDVLDRLHAMQKGASPTSASGPPPPVVTQQPTVTPGPLSTLRRPGQ